VKFADLVNPDDLRRALDEGMVRARESGDGQAIYNYSDAAMWTPGAWDNPAVRQCRGVIVQDGDVIARPWAKFFNHGQAEAGSLDMTAPVEVTDKMDGSLGIIHRAPDGRLRVATRGSFASDQAIHATTILRRRYAELEIPNGVTPLVEIIYPGNRIVCDYGPLDDLVLLGGVGHSTGDYYGPDDVRALIEWDGPVAATFPFATLADALASPPRKGAEGLCVRYVDRPHIVKIKQADYVALHRIVTGLSERTVWEAMAEGKAVTDLLEGIPDELHQWVRDVWAGLDGAKRDTLTAAEHAHTDVLTTLPNGWGRREYAEQAKTRGHLTPFLFQLLDGRDPGPAILKTLRPSGDTRAKTYSEDVA
jgi:RNA ligase